MTISLSTCPARSWVRSCSKLSCSPRRLPGSPRRCRHLRSRPDQHRPSSPRPDGRYRLYRQHACLCPTTSNDVLRRCTSRAPAHPLALRRRHHPLQQRWQSPPSSTALHHRLQRTTPPRFQRLQITSPQSPAPTRTLPAPSPRGVSTALRHARLTKRLRPRPLLSHTPLARPHRRCPHRHRCANRARPPWIPSPQGQLWPRPLLLLLLLMKRPAAAASPHQHPCHPSRSQSTHPRHPSPCTHTPYHLRLRRACSRI